MPTLRGMSMVTIKLTEDEARLVAQNVDGWLDAGAGEGGLESKERDALQRLYAQCTKRAANQAKGDACC